MNMAQDFDHIHDRKESPGVIRLILYAVSGLIFLAAANISGLIGLGLVLVAIGYAILFCVGMEFTTTRLAISIASAAIGISLCGFHLYFGDDTRTDRNR